MENREWSSRPVGRESHIRTLPKTYSDKREHGRYMYTHIHVHMKTYNQNSGKQTSCCSIKSLHGKHRYCAIQSFLQSIASQRRAAFGPRGADEKSAPQRRGQGPCAMNNWSNGDARFSMGPASDSVVKPAGRTESCQRKMSLWYKGVISTIEYKSMGWPSSQ